MKNATLSPDLVRPRRGDGLRAVMKQRDAAWAKMEKLTAKNKQLRKALQGLLPRGWRDGTMDHMSGVKDARVALGARVKPGRGHEKLICGGCGFHHAPDYKDCVWLKNPY